jgi:hypothetical protein
MFAPAENLISLATVTFEPHLVKFQGEVAESVLQVCWRTRRGGEKR